MSWNLDKNRPICPQLCEQISVKIACGELKPGEKLMSVREVALSAGVNPNTVQKAFEQLAAAELIYSERNVGWFVKENTAKAIDTVEFLRKEKAKAFLSEMQLLGLDTVNVIKLLEEWDK